MIGALLKGGFAIIIFSEMIDIIHTHTAINFGLSHHKSYRIYPSGVIKVVENHINKGFSVYLKPMYSIVTKSAQHILDTP